MRWWIEIARAAEGGAGAGNGGGQGGQGGEQGGGGGQGGQQGSGGGQGGQQGGGDAGGGRLAAAAAAAGGDPAKGGDPAAGGDPAKGAPEAGKVYRPEGLPDHLVGKSDNETIDNLAKAVKGYRDQDAKRGPIPKEAAEYRFEPPETLKGYFDRPDDPAMAAAQAAALKHGMTAPQFQGFLADVFGPLAEKGMIAPPFDPMAELKSIAKGLGFPETREGQAETAKATQNAEAFAKGLAAQLGLGQAETSHLAVFADTAAGVITLTKLAAAMGSRGPQLDGRQVGHGATTKEDLKAMAGDPRIDPNSPTYDKRMREQYDADYQRIYGGK